MIRVLIADDHPIVREGLKQVIDRAEDMRVMGEALNGQELLDLVYRESWDVVVVDFSMPGKSTIDVLRDLKKERPRLPVLVLSMYPENELAPRVLRVGASGYLTKESAPKELVNAIRKLHGGGKYVSPALAEKLAADLAGPSDHRAIDLLSDREYEVLCLLATGKTVQEIADQFSLSVKTVRTYRERLLEKLTLKNDVELTHYAITHGLLKKM